MLTLEFLPIIRCRRYPALRPARQISIALALSCASLGAGPAAPEEEVRAAFLFHLAKFVTWPESAAAGPIRFCVFENDRLTTTLHSLIDGKSIQGRSIIVHAVSKSLDSNDCDLAYLGVASPRRLELLFRRWTYPPVLLVGESAEFIPCGGMVNLEMESGRIAFRVNLPVIRRAGLNLRSQLLRFARLAGEAGPASRVPVAPSAATGSKP